MCYMAIFSSARVTDFERVSRRYCAQRISSFLASLMCGWRQATEGRRWGKDWAEKKLGWSVELA
jgi:hypothetical protein